MKLFTEEDFINLKYCGPTGPSAAYAEYANNKLNELLQSATVVYCDKDELHFSGVDEIGYTHKGYLIGVEEIKKEPCKHEKVFVDVKLNYQMQDPITRMWRFDENQVTFGCRACGVEIFPDWKVK